MEMTIDQQRAMAMAAARLRMQQQSAETKPALTGPSAIPTEPGANLAPTAAPEQTFGQKVMGAIEAPFAVGASVLGGIPTYLAGAGGPKFQQQVADQIQYQPRTPQAQAAVETVARAADALKLPPFMGPVAGANALARGLQPATRAVADVARAENALIGGAIKAPLEARAARIQEGRVAQSYANAPMIDAVQSAQRIGGAVPPAISNPTTSNVIKGKLAGPEIEQQFAKKNEVAVTEAVRKDLGIKPNERLIPEVDELTGKLNVNSPIARALDEASKSYEPVRKMESLAVPKESIDALEALKKAAPIGGDAKTAAINSVIDDALAKLQQTTSGPFSGVGGGPVAVGRSGAMVLDDIRSLKRDAQATRRAQQINPDPLAIAKAEAQESIVKILEGVIDANAPSPKILREMREGRTRMAQIYEHENAINYGQQKIDPQAYAKLYEERQGGMTGLNADIAKAASMFPDYFTLTPAEVKGLPRLTRGGVGGAIGGALGAPLGPVGFVAGTATGMGFGSAVGSLAARRMATPAYQRANALPADYRPIPSGLRPVEPNATPNGLVPFDYSQQTTQAPNFVLRSGQEAPVYEQPSYPQLTQFGDSQTTLNALRNQDARARARSLVAGQQAEAAQAAAEMRARVPTGRGVELEWDPITKTYREVTPTGAGGVLPTPSALESAVAKMSGQVIEQPITSYKTMQISPKSGQTPYTRIIKREGETTFERGVPQAFAMTAEEKIAWNKAKADLAEVMPGMKTLSDEAIASRMADVKWSEQAVANARAKAEQLARQEALLTEQLANRDNLRLMARDIEAKNKQLVKIKSDRQNMMALAEQMEERLRAARPVKTGGQGPKTRAFQRNMLRPEGEDIQNALVK